MQQLREYMKAKRLSLALRRKVRAHILVLHERSHIYDERKILHKLPPGMQAKVLAEIYGDKIAAMPLFNCLNSEELNSLYIAMRPFPAHEGMTIFSRGEVAREIFFIMSGERECILSPATVPHTWCVVLTRFAVPGTVQQSLGMVYKYKQLKAGSFFGEEIWTTRGIGRTSSVSDHNQQNYDEARRPNFSTDQVRSRALPQKLCQSLSGCTLAREPSLCCIYAAR
jgi:hypothetical protein